MLWKERLMEGRWLWKIKQEKQRNNKSQHVLSCYRTIDVQLQVFLKPFTSCLTVTRHEAPIILMISNAFPFILSCQLHINLLQGLKQADTKEMLVVLCFPHFLMCNIWPTSVFAANSPIKAKHSKPSYSNSP